MYKEIKLTVTEHSYLKELTEFNKEALIKDFAKVVQLKWDKDALQRPVRKKIYQMYVKEVACIVKHTEYSFFLQTCLNNFFNLRSL